MKRVVESVFDTQSYWMHLHHSNPLAHSMVNYEQLLQVGAAALTSTATLTPTLTLTPTPTTTNHGHDWPQPTQLTIHCTANT